MGTACTRADERVAAAMGLVQCATARFEKVHDVQMGGLLSGLPALCANGLLSGLERHLRLPQGFYSALPLLSKIAEVGLFVHWAQRGLGRVFQDGACVCCPTSSEDQSRLGMVLRFR